MQSNEKDEKDYNFELDQQMKTKGKEII